MMKKSSDLNVTIMNVSTNQKHLWAIALILALAFQMNAQCLVDWSFKNVNDIPSTCNMAWSEEGINMQMIPTTPSTSCNTGSGCVFSIIQNAPNQYNFLNVISGALEVNIPDPANFYTMSFKLNESSGACQTVRYFNGSSLVLEVEVIGNYYITAPNVNSGLTFDKISIDVINTQLYGFELKYICNDGAPVTNTTIDFEEIPQGAYGGTGTSGPFLTSKGVDLYVSNENGDNLPPNQAQYFIEDTRPLVFGHGLNFFWPQHTVKYDFTVLPNPITSVFFDIADNDLDVILKVNGDLTFIGQMSYAPTNIASNVTLIDLGPLGNTSGRRYQLDGIIEDFVYGGSELFIDNVGFVQGQLLNCNVSSLFLQNQDCNSDGTIDLDFYMAEQDAPSNTFAYYVDGLFAGSATINADREYRVENLVTDNNMEHTFSICIDGVSNCCADFIFYTPNCTGTSCLDFVGFAQYGVTFGNVPGDTIPLRSNDGTVATIQNYFNADSISSFQTLSVRPNQSDYHNPESINLNLDFSAVNGTINSLSFRAAGNCCAWFGLNNEYTYLDNIADLPSALPSNFSYINYGTYWTIEGPEINHFSVGGGNFDIGDFCYSLANANCGMAEVTISLGDCDTNNEATATFNFIHTGTTDSFNLQGNGINYGVFAYNDLPIDVNGFAADGTTTYSLSAIDLIDTDCSIGLDFGPVTCAPPDCSLSDGSFENSTGCDPSGSVSVEIDFNYVGTSDSFICIQNGINVGTFAYADLPIDLAGFDGTGQTDNEVQIIDQSDSDCTLNMNIWPLFCNNICDGIELVPTDQTCNNDGTINFDLIYMSTYTGPFEVFMNGNSLGIFDQNANSVYSFQNVTILPGVTNLISACNDIGQQCCQTFAFTPIDCPPVVCEITSAQITNQQCQQNVEALIEILVDNPTDDLWEWWLNGTYRGTYNFNASNSYIIQLTDGALPGAMNTIQVCVNDNPNCCYEFDFLMMGTITNVVTTPLACQTDGNYNILVDLEYLGTEDSFDLSYSLLPNTPWENLGTFAFSDLPVEVGPFVGDGSEYVLNAGITTDVSCFDFANFGPVLCPVQDCELANSSYIVQEDCDPNGNVSVEIDFFHVGTADSFICIQNGINIGTYAYVDLPIIFGSFDGTGQSDNEVQIIDQDDDNCTLNIDIGSIDCSFVCGFNEFLLNEQHCNADGSVDLQFILIMPTPGDFELFINGNSLGNFNSNPNVLYTVQNIDVIPNEINVLTACNLNGQQCCQTTLFTGADCPVNNCSVTNMAFSNQECDNGVPYGSLMFAVENANNDQYEYWINGVYQGIDNLNVNSNGIHNSVISLADANPTSLNELTVCINDNPDCCHSIPFQVISCPDPCNLSGMEIINISDCDPNNLFTVTFNLTHTGSGSQFTLTGNGQNYGNYFYSDLPVSIGMGPGGNSTFWELIATDTDNTDCSTFVEIGNIDCPGSNCTLTDLNLLAISCDGTEPFATLEFNYSDPGNDFYEWWINGEYQGMAILGSNGQTSAVIALTDGQVGIDNLLEVCINDQPDCCQSIFFEQPNCNVCEITNLSLTDQQCDGNISYGTVTLNVDNPGNNNWEWWINGTYQGIENFDPSGSYLVNLADANPTGINLLQVCVNDNANCCETIEFELIDCSDPCIIEAVQVEILDCNTSGFFNVNLFASSTNNSGSFNLTGNGINYGQYNYADLPIIVESFEGNGSTVYELVMTDAQFPDCQNEVEFGPVDCNPVGNCSITELSLTNIDCDGIDAFGTVSFQVNNPGNDFWEWSINGISQGTENLNATNEYIVNLSSATIGIINTLQVCINDQPNCCQTIDFEILDCSTICEIGVLNISIGDCNPNQTIEVSVDFDHIGTSDQFTLQGNGQNYGTFNYSDLPITLGLAGDGTTIYELIATDVNNNDCQNFVEFGPLDCDPIDDCSVLNVTLNEIYCAGDNAEGLLYFEVNNPGNDFWEYYINGNFVDLLPLQTINEHTIPLTGALSGQINTIQVCINDNPDCCSIFTFEVDECVGDDGCIGIMPFPAGGSYGSATGHTSGFIVPTNPGAILTIEEYQISSTDPILFGNLSIPDFSPFDGTLFDIGLNASFENFNNGVEQVSIELYGGCCFFLGINGDNNYFQSLSDIPAVLPNGYSVTMTSINTSAGDGTLLTINGAGIEDFFIAGTDIPYRNLCYELDAASNCEIGELNISVGDCNANQTVIVTVDFDFANTSDQFTLQGNGQNYGTFSYTDLPIDLSFIADGTTTYELIAIDVDNNDCQNFIDFGPLDCDPIGDCVISDLVLNEITCDGDISVGTLFFEVVSPGNDFWEYSINGTLIDFLPLENINEFTIPLTGATTGSNTLEVCINDNPYCCYSITFEVDDCIADSDCISFMPFANGASFGSATGELPGFILPTMPQSVQLTLEEYQINSSSPVSFGNLDIPDFSPYDGTLFEIGVNADFGNFNGAVNQVSVEIYGGCCFYLGVNGDNNYYDSLADIPAVLLNGYNVEIDIINTSAGQGNLLSITGDGIESFFFAGTDIPFRNICYDLEAIVPNDNCLDFQGLQAGLELTNSNTTLPIILFTQDNVEVTLNDCGPTDFFVMEVRDDEFCNIVEQGENSIYLQGASLDYDFTNISPIPNQVSFNFCGEGILNINGNDIEVDFDTAIPAGGINLGNGYYLHVTAIPNVTFGFTLTVSGGPIETMTVCGLEASVGPPCFEFVPDSTDDCYGFENLLDGGYYALGTDDQRLSLYNSAGLKVDLINDAVPNGAVGITSQITSTIFNGAAGNYAFLFGAMEFDFSDLTDPTEFVSFDFAGTDFSISVNNEPEINFPGMETLDTLLIAAPGVVLYFHRESSNPSEGQVSLFGEVANLVIASEEILLDNICYYLEIQAPDVWPGDVNSDNIADHCDLVYLGIANGTSGPERGNPTADWEGQGALDWDQQFLFESTNFKHADANGDGIIDFNDYEVLVENLGKVHGPEPDWTSTPGTSNDPPLYIDLNANGPLVAGEPFSVPIVLGSDAIPVADIYGLVFSIEFDEEDLDLSNTTLSLNNSWLGSDLWKIEKVVAEDGRVDVGITRTTRVDTSGNGEIAEFTGIIDNLVGKEIQVAITNVKAMTHDETPVLIYAQSNSGSVTTNTDKDDLDDGLHIFPVPTTDVLYIRNYSERDIQAIKIFNVLGQQMLSDRGPRKLNQYHLSAFASGTYFVELHFIGEKITRKIQVMKD